MKKLFLAFGLLGLLWSPATLAAELIVNQQPIAPKTLPKNAIRVPFLQVQLHADGGVVRVNALDVERTGLSDSDDFGRIWAETSTYLRSFSRQLDNDDLVHLRFRRPIILLDGQRVSLVIFANLEFESGGRTATFNLQNVESDAEHTTGKPSRWERTPQPKPVLPRAKSHRKITYDRSTHRIKCKNRRCYLVPRN